MVAGMTGKTPTPLTDVAWRIGAVVIRDLAQRLERDMAELSEALRYWIPDESKLPSTDNPFGDERILAYRQKWYEHIALLARIEKEGKT